MDATSRLEARVVALETVLLEFLRKKDFEEASEYQMGRSEWEIWMDKIQAARDGDGELES